MLLNDLGTTLSLAGPWEFALGEGAPWAEIGVPGCWEAQGYSMLGEGPAHYRRQVFIPDDWAEQSVWAEFDAVSYACTVRLNGQQVGSHRGLWTPFAADLTTAARPGEGNLLELEVYKPGRHYPVRGTLAGFLPDVATTFGGIWQPARLRALKAGIKGLSVEADAEARTLRVRCEARGLEGGEWQVEVCRGRELVATTRVRPEPGSGLDVCVALAQADLWSPRNPVLYTVQVSLWQGSELVARASRRTGFRRLSADGDQLLLNGSPFMVRGVLSWGWQPDRIAPTYTRSEVRAELRRVRALGFNTVKLCLFVPNQDYYDVADEEGMIVWQEWPMWLPEVSPDLRRAAPGEYAALTQLTCHHPSVALYSLGCELNRTVDAGLLSLLDATVRGLVRGALVCDNSGCGESYGGLDHDLADFTDYHPYCDLHYFDPLLDNWRRDWKNPRPLIMGEFCDSDTYRDSGEIVRANGGRRPWWLTAANPVTTWRPEAQAMVEAEERLARASPGLSPQELVRISYAQSLVIRKHTLEALRRRSGVGGYVVTGLRDTPIATSGVLDDLGRPKWTAEEWLPINGDAVLSLDAARRRRWRHGGDRPDRLDPHNLWAGEAALWHVILSLTQGELPAGSELKWALLDEAGEGVAAGSTATAWPILPGPPHQVGVVDCTLPSLTHAAEFRLQVSVAGGGLEVGNQWPVWVYPRLPAAPSRWGIYDPCQAIQDCSDWERSVRRAQAGNLASFEVVVATVWDDPLGEYVTHGGRVLLLQQGDGPLPAWQCPFWREAIKLFCAHPVWKGFPQSGYTDLQFFGLACDVAFDTSGLEQVLPRVEGLRPILRRLDARQFLMGDYLFEANLGRGTILACALRLQGGAGAQPLGWERNVAGGALLQALLGYLMH